MRAIVLVGGFGTRLRPLTLHTPKQMLPVVDRPMLEWVIAELGKHGVDQAVLSLGYRPDAFQAAYPDDRCAGVELVYAVEPEPLDTAGAIRFAARHAGVEGRFVVANGDVLTDLDITALVSRHDELGAEATIALHQVEDPSRYGVVDVDERGRVRAFVEKPPVDEAPSTLINAGTYVFEASVLDRIPEGRAVSVEREVFPALVADGALAAVHDGGAYWLDTGTPAAYLTAQLDVLDGRRGVTVAAVHPGAEVADGAFVERSVVSCGAVVGSGAVLQDAVLLEGAVVREGARVVRSIVGPRARVGVGAVLDDLCVLGEGAQVDDGAALHGVRLPEPD